MLNSPDNSQAFPNINNNEYARNNAYRNMQNRNGGFRTNTFAFLSNLFNPPFRNTDTYSDIYVNIDTYKPIKIESELENPNEDIVNEEYLNEEKVDEDISEEKKTEKNSCTFNSCS